MKKEDVIQKSAIESIFKKFGKPTVTPSPGTTEIPDFSALRGIGEEASADQTLSREEKIAADAIRVIADTVLNTTMYGSGSK